MSSERDRLPLAAWVFLLVVLLAAIGWGAHQPYSWDADNIAPGSVLKGLAQRFGPGWFSSYGPIPYYLTALAYAPALAIMKLTGEIGVPSPEYPWGFVHPGVSVTALVVIARLVTLALALVVAWTLAAAARRGTAAARGWIVPVLLAGSPVFVYYARTSNVDMHYVVWLALGYHLLDRRDRAPLALAAIAAAATAAVCSKEQAAPFALVLLLEAMRRALVSGRRWNAALAVIAGATLTYAVAWMLPFNVAGWRGHLDFLFHVARYERTYPLTPAGIGALGTRLVELLPVGLGWPVIAGLALAPFLRPSARDLLPRAAGAALYLLTFIGPVGYIYPRFLLPLLIVLVPLAARALERAFERAERSPGLSPALGAGLLLLTLSGGVNLDAVMLTDPRHAVSRWLEHLPAGTVVEIAGNPRFQAPAPRALRAIYCEAGDLRAAPRGPRGDVVLLSSLDEAYFRRDPIVRAAWWDSLTRADGAYRPPIWFRPPRATGNILNLFVAPTVQAYVRRREPEIAAPAR